MRKTIAVVLVALLKVTNLLGAVILPAGLAPGSQYQLIFVTADVRDAVSTSIGDYNKFVTNEAGLGIPSGLPSGLTWKAVASTAAKSANGNALSGALPLYNTNGQQVTAAGVGIYAGALENLVAYDQFGNFNTAAQTHQVWTGSDASGNGLANATLGGGGNGEVGQFALDGTWLQFTPEPQVVAEKTFSRAFYALSGPITFVATPEPATVTIWGLSILVLSARRLQRWRRPQR